MYEIADFKEYDPSKGLGLSPVLVWSKKDGYHFLSLVGRISATTEGTEFKIIGVLKEGPCIS